MRLPSIRPTSQPTLRNTSRPSSGSDTLPPLTRGAWSSTSRGSSRGSRGGGRSTSPAEEARGSSLADELEARLEAAAAARRKQRGGGGGVRRSPSEPLASNALESSGDLGGAGLFLTALMGDDDDDAAAAAAAAAAVAAAAAAARSPSAQLREASKLSAADEARLTHLLGVGDDDDDDDDGDDDDVGAAPVPFLQKRDAASRRLAQIDAQLTRMRGVGGASAASSGASLILSRSTRSFIRSKNAAAAENGGAPPSQKRGKSPKLSKAEQRAERQRKAKEYAQQQRAQAKQRRQQKQQRGGSGEDAAAKVDAAPSLNFDHENLMLQQIDGKISELQASLATESSVAPRSMIERLLLKIKHEEAVAAAREEEVTRAHAERIAQRPRPLPRPARRPVRVEQRVESGEEEEEAPLDLAALLARAQGLTMEEEEDSY